ncbi:uncharacterized protein LOC141630087 [Silene latifolia]|uniref:uncharacterized protein LOC141630087 n=1 Tax=Silene latifolia TaxID=37657 RepID=UPI003D77DB1F
MRVHEQYKLVEVNRTRTYSKYDPFILAHQAHQVYFATYPSTTNDRNQNAWCAIFKTKARSQVDTTFFQEENVSNETLLSPPDEINYEHENKDGEDMEEEEFYDVEERLPGEDEAEEEEERREEEEERRGEDEVRRRREEEKRRKDEGFGDEDDYDDDDDEEEDEDEDEGFEDEDD